jgi:hypothetical protein
MNTKQETIKLYLEIMDKAERILAFKGDEALADQIRFATFARVDQMIHLDKKP